MTTDQLIQAFKAKHKLTSSIETDAPMWFVPIAELINVHQKRDDKCLYVGLNGSQGSGKSTLADFIKEYLENKYNLSVAVISLDDFYLSKQERAVLASSVHPLLQSRGVPGTHNTELMLSTLTALQSKTPNCCLPRFNKAIDDPEPIENWPLITDKVDVVIMEGWCWGTPEQSEEQLTQPINHLEQLEDPDCTWRTYVNESLKSDYSALYNKMDMWLMLKAPSFDCISKWRKEQEHKLRQSHSFALLADAKKPSEKATSAIMTDAQVARFIQHFQRLTEHGFTTVPQKCDLVLQLDSKRAPISIEGKAVTEFNHIRSSY